MSDGKHFRQKTNQTNESCTVFVKNLDCEVCVDEIKSIIYSNAPNCRIKDIRLVRDFKGRNKGYAYVDFYKEAIAQEVVNKLNEYVVRGRQLHFAISQPTKDLYEQNKVFVPLIHESELNKLIPSNLINHLTIRQVRNNCFIDTENEDIMNQLLNIIPNSKRSIPMKDHRHQLAPAPKREDSLPVVIAKNLPFKFNEINVKELLGVDDYSTISLATNSRGKSKGFAFIECRDFKEVNRLLSGKFTHEKGQVVIQKSDRPLTFKKPKDNTSESDTPEEPRKQKLFLG